MPLPACRVAVAYQRPRPHIRPPRRTNGGRMRRCIATAIIRTAGTENSAMAVRTPKSAPSGNPPRSGSAATLRTEKASGTYARRLSMVWTYRNDPRCHWLRSRRPQGIGTESVYAACLLYLFLATISRLTPPYLRNPTAEAGLVRSLRQGGFFWGGAPICKRGSAANAPAAGRVQRLGKPTECKAS